MCQPEGPSCDWLSTAQTAERVYARKRSDLSAMRFGVVHRGAKAPSGKRETEKAGKRAGWSCSVVVLPKSLGCRVCPRPSGCASDCRWPKPACSARVPALAEAVILAQSRANVALKFNRVALSLAYYCDEEHC